MLPLSTMNEAANLLGGNNDLFALVLQVFISVSVLVKNVKKMAVDIVNHSPVGAISSETWDDDDLL